jgi:hypothetical protein
MSSPPRGLSHQAVNAHPPTVHRQQRTWFSGPRIRRRGSTLRLVDGNSNWSSAAAGRVLAVVESGDPSGRGLIPASLRRPSPCIDLRDRSSIKRGRGFAVWRWKVLYRLLGLWTRYPRGTVAILVMGALGRISVRAPRGPLRKVSAVRSHHGPPRIGDPLPIRGNCFPLVRRPCRVSPYEIERPSFERGLLLPIDIVRQDG